MACQSLLRGVHKIAVLRANAIGDLVFVLPALAALRAAYPQAELVLLATDWHADFLHERPGPIDRVIPVPPCAGVRVDLPRPPDEQELAAFFERMRAEHFDLALQLHGGGRHSNPFVRNLGAKLTAGLRTPDALPLDRWLPYIYYQPEVVRYLEAVALVGAQPVTLAPALALTSQDWSESLAVVPETSQMLAVLHPGAGDGRRRWAPEKFAAVGDALAAAGARVFVIGTGPERLLVAAVIAHMRLPGINLCERLSLGGLAGLLSRARVVVSNDSGPLHLAGAVGAATVGIFWCGNLVTAAPLTRSRHRPLVSWRLTCPICSHNCMSEQCEHRTSFVDDVPVEDVRSAALELLALPPQHPGVTASGVSAAIFGGIV